MLIFGGSENDLRPAHLIRGYVNRLRDEDDGSAVVPHAFFSDVLTDDPEPHVTLLKRVADELRETMPPGSGRLTLPTFDICCRVLDAEPGRGALPARRTNLVKHLYAQRGGSHLDAEIADRVGSAAAANWVTALLSAVLTPFLKWAPELAYQFRLTQGRTFRKLADQVRLVAGLSARDFLGSALRLTSDGSERRNVAVVQRFLLMALILDLQAAGRRSLFRVKFRRRRWPFLVLFDDVTDQASPQRQLLDAYLETVRSIRRSPLFLVAGMTGPPPAYTRQPQRTNLDAVADELTGHLEPARRGRRSTVSAWYVPLPEGPFEQHAEMSLQSRRKVVGRPSRRRDYVPAVLAVALVATAITAPVYYVSNRSDPCGDTWVTEIDERVGITDGSCLFTAQPTLLADATGKATPEKRNYDRLLQVEKSIKAQNDEVLRKFHERGLAYRTVVFFGPLTKPSLPGRNGEVYLQQIQGVALAQQRANAEAEADENKVRSRVLMANPGDRYANAVAVAQRIIAMADRDPKIVAVVGISHSRKESKEAIDLLTNARLTVVASTVTADDISRSSYFYQVAPINDRQAAMAAAFAYRTEPVKNRLGILGPARRVVVIQDPRDIYSQNLGEDFRKHFTALGGKIVDTFSYQSDTLQSQAVHDPRLNGTDTIVVNAADLALHVCRVMDPEKDLIYYTGRSHDLSAFLDAFRQDSRCGNKPITILSGDDATGFVSDGEQTKYPFLLLYYAAFSYPENRSNISKDFALRFRQAYGEAPDDSSSALGYDSFEVAREAINKAFQPKNTDFERSVVATKLYDGQIDFNGVSGVITFTQSRRVPLNKPVFILEAGANNKSSVKLRCGRFAGGGAEVTRWGAGRHPCPMDIE